MRLRLPIARTAAALAAVALVAGCGGGDDKQATTPEKPKANSVAASQQQLRGLSKSVGHDIFWAGPKNGFTYELTRTKDGNIYVRYLPPGVKVGSPSSEFLTIGTYPQKDAFATVEKASKRPGENKRELDGGGLAVWHDSKPNSVYFAYPGSTLLVEVYARDPAAALRSVTRGTVQPLR